MKIVFTFLLLLAQIGPAPSAEIGETIRRKGIAAKRANQFDSALYYYKESLKLFEEINHVKGIADVSNNLGILYCNLGDFEQGLRFYNKSLKLFIDSNDRLGQAKVAIGLGNFYSYEEQDFEEARKNYFQSLAIYSKSDDPLKDQRIMSLYNNLGNVYSKVHPGNKLYNLDSGQYYYRKAHAINKSIFQDSVDFGGYFLNMAQVMESINVDSAMAYYDRSIKIFEAIENDFKIASVYLTRGHFYMKRDTKKAIADNLLAFDISSKQGYWDFIRGSTRNLTELYAKKNTDSAFHFLKIQMQFKDSIYYNSKINAIENLRISYESQSKDQQLKLNEATILIKTTENRTLMLTLFIVAGCAIVVILFNQKRLKAQKNLRQKDQELREKDQELHQQQVDQMVRDQELKSINAMLEGEEKERKRIAEDLHDRVGSMLSAMKLQTDTSDTKLTTLLDETVDEVRRISHNLETKVLNKFGLIAALEDLADKIKGSEKINFDLQYLDLTERLENKVEINAYRIVQELISNALKHSRATEIVTQVNRIEDQLVITVEDDGVGFNSLAVKESSSGMGLRNVMSRAHELNGHFNVDSGKGQGTMITVEFPI